MVFGDKLGMSNFIEANLIEQSEENDRQCYIVCYVMNRQQMARRSLWTTNRPIRTGGQSAMWQRGSLNGPLV